MDDHLKAEQMREVLGLGEEEDLAAVLHLLRCRLCQALALTVLDPPDEEEDELWSELWDRPFQISGELLLLSRVTADLHEELLALEPQRRLTAILEPKKRAASALIRSWLLFSAEGSPLSQARSGLGLAVCLAALGQREPAERLLEENRPRRESSPEDRAERLRLEWLEGRIETHLGNFEAAGPRLEGVLGRLLEEERLVDSALCAVDLAYVYAKLGRTDAVPHLAHRVGCRFPGSLGLSRVLVALCGFLDAVRRGDGDLEAAARRAEKRILQPEAWRELPAPKEN